MVHPMKSNALYTSTSLKDHYTNEKVIQQLYQHNFIQQQARYYALDLLYGYLPWGKRISAILFWIGLIFLSTGFGGILFLQWNQLSTYHQLLLLEIALLGCIVGAFVYLPHRKWYLAFISGATLFTGIFLLLFQHAYQGEMAYSTIFFLWCILILPWTIISHSTALWINWSILFTIGLLFWIGTHL